MKTKKTLLLFFLLFWAVLPAQRVGINTSDPKATLEIKSSDLQNPSPTDGFLVPKVEKLNLNLTADQDGMILFLITDWVDTSVTPNIVYSAGLYTFDWNYTTQSGNWLKLLASKATTKPITVFRSLSSGKIAIGDVGGGRSNGTDFTSLPGNDNILKATLVKTVSQTEYFKIHMTTPLESSAYLTIVTLESRGIEILSSGFERIPQITKELTPDQVADVEKLLEKIEEDDDVMNVYHTMQESAE